LGKDCTSRVKEHGVSVQDTRETSARTAHQAEAVFKEAEISLKQAQKKVPHHVQRAAIGTAEEGTLYR